MKLEAKALCFSYDMSGMNEIGFPGNESKRTKRNRTTREILSRFDLTLESGELVGAAAPSGFGKTTLCRLLAGYLKPSAGEILLDGKPLASYRGYCPVQMIWQQPELAVDPKMRMRNMIAEGDEVELRVLDALGIREEWMGRYPQELSGGELQRFCIARALGKRTRFLLADEITTMLDLVTQSEIWHFLMDEIRRRGIGLLAVSHDRELLDRICTRQIDLQADQGAGR